MGRGREGSDTLCTWPYVSRVLAASVARITHLCLQVCTPLVGLPQCWGQSVCKCHLCRRLRAHQCWHIYSEHTSCTHWFVLHVARAYVCLCACILTCFVAFVRSDYMSV